jgi:hypothetical protein
MNKIKILKLNPLWVMTATAPFFIIVLFIFRFMPKIQFQILTLASLTYLTLAILHHLRDKTLTLELVIEYVLIAALALIVLQGLLI